MACRSDLVCVLFSVDMIQRPLSFFSVESNYIHGLHRASQGLLLALKVPIAREEMRLLERKKAVRVCAWKHCQAQEETGAVRNWSTTCASSCALVPTPRCPSWKI